MAPKYAFISGLPRSGSTLLAAILLQNPEFSAGMHSGLSLLWVNAINSMSTNKEFQAQVKDEQRIKILQGIVENFYLDKQDKKIVFDTARTWQKWVDVLVKLWPDVKIICCVRDVGWIADSLERLHKSRPWATNYFWPNNTGIATVYDRINGLQSTTNMVGYSLAAISEGLKSEHADHMLLVDYDILTQFPKDTMMSIYSWLGEPYYEGHDFENIEFSANEYDKQLNVEGLHTIRPKVEANKRETILPAELFERMSNLTAMWKGVENSKAQFILCRDKEGPIRIEKIEEEEPEDEVVELG